MTLIELAIAFVIGHPGVTSAIVGPRTMEQLESYLPAADITLSPNVLDRIDELVAPGVTLNPDDNSYARAAGLRYSSDDEPGISRRRSGRGSSYRTERGGAVRGERQLARIRALGIPPAWTRVWICRDARGHIQATGRDARGRKQYLYHTDWRALRGAAKFDRMLDFFRRK